ncbi:MAG: hypothetical protein ACRELD_15240 [Longimicrobiales bacterium]
MLGLRRGPARLRRGRALPLACLLIAALIVPPRLAAQAAGSVEPAVLGPRVGTVFAPAVDTAAPAGAALLLSAVVPGAGQWRLGAERWILFTTLEIWGWLSFADHRHEARVLEREYRDLAWSVARRVSTGERRDGDFEYYEALASTLYEASGAFDVDPGVPGIQPETDPATYNGQTWRLAQALFLPSGAAADPALPEYQRALEYYLENATPPEFAWSWGDNRIEQQLYRRLIRESDEAFRSATARLGILLANHVLSAIDAFAIARLGGTVGVELRGLPGRDAAAFSIRLPAPWQ